MPSFASGEVKPSCGPGRREVGHGHSQALTAVKPMLPDQEKFPLIPFASVPHS